MSTDAGALFLLDQVRDRETVRPPIVSEELRGNATLRDDRQALGRMALETGPFASADPVIGDQEQRMAAHGWLLSSQRAARHRCPRGPPTQSSVSPPPHLTGHA